MSSKGITYFRLTSPYDGDVTKNCSLEATEVDNNFYVLEGRDVKTVYVEGNKIKIGLLNGDVISSDDVFGNFAKNLSFTFDAENGKLHINNNGVEQIITGFVTEFSDDKSVASDHTLSGSGKPSDPLRISKSYRTGKYEPALSVIDVVGGASLPADNTPGDRYVVREEMSDYGYLYNYDSVTRIACDLASSNSGWRIPTKEDWDDMLNAVEPCGEDKDHTSASCNKYLGRFAGKMLKSVDGWKSECCSSGMDSYCANYQSTCCSCTCGKKIECSPVYCGEYTSCCNKPTGMSNNGIDKYGFRVLPAGYADDGGNIGYFGERAYFWTATNSNCGSSAYAKRFEYNKSNVYQDVISSKNSLSLRLVKTFDGSNYLEREEILGMYVPTVLMPSVKSGHAIWTEVNVAFADKVYNPMQPNYGLNVPMSTRYYIYEWDGCKWLVNTLTEGESIVILNAPDGKYGHEYQIINDVLVCATDRITDAVLSDVNQTLNSLDSRISAETERAYNKETELENNLNEVSNRLDEEINARNASEESIYAKIQEESDERKLADSTLERSINDLSEALNSAVEELTESINQEQAERQAKDEEIEGKLSEEQTAREAKDAEIDEKISELEAKDIELETKISDEATAREDGDNVLDEKIDSAKAEISEALNQEQAERQAKDEEIEGKLVVADGSNFDVSTGIITLKSNDGSNDIKIQLVLNMGTI